MAFVNRKTLFILIGLSAVTVLGVGGFIWSGLYNIGADDPHTGPVYAVLETLRERSIEVRASKLEVPDLADPARIIQGAGNYNAMCKGCHLAPGMAETELSRGLYPAPPDLTKARVEEAEAFWAIKHGIKASGMPAWGKSMGDKYIWNMAAFLQQLPSLTSEQYEKLVASSEGHSHGGGETHGHTPAEGTSDPHRESQAGDTSTGTHEHLPGTLPHEHESREPRPGNNHSHEHEH